MSTHLQVFLGEADWQRLPEPHRTQFADWLTEHGYRGIPFISDPDWIEGWLRRVPPQVCATVLLQWLRDHNVVGKLGTHVLGSDGWRMDCWHSNFPNTCGSHSAGGWEEFVGPSPVQACWAAVLRVLGVQS